MKSTIVTFSTLLGLVAGLAGAAPPPNARAWLAAAPVGESVYLIGGGVCSGPGCGNFGGEQVGEVEAYDTNSWKTSVHLGIPRFGLNAVAANGVVYAIGGISGSSSQPVGVVEEFTPQTNTWSSRTSLPVPRWKAASISDGESIYVIGGGPTGNQCQPSRIVEKYNPQTNQWDTKASMPTARWGGAATIINGDIYVIGGSSLCPHISVQPLSTVEVYSPISDSWSSKSPMPTARWDLAVSIVNQKIYAVGGWDPVQAKALATLEEYDVSTDTWTTKAPMPTPRTGLVAFSARGKLYTYGGFDGNNVTDAVEVYNPITNTWETLPSAFLIAPIPGTPDLAKKRISSVLDHHVPTGYNCNIDDTCSDDQGIKKVLAYDGQEGKIEYGANCSPPGYKKNVSGSVFDFSSHFDYVASCGGKAFLNYDGHSGYDFAYGEGTPIVAAASGLLEVPTSDSVNNAGGSDPQTAYNTLRIVHSNGYETWYLHALRGSECVAFGTCPVPPSPGDTVSVAAGQKIAEVGNTGTSSYHLHFEVRKGSNQPVDPFGCSHASRDDDLACRGRLWMQNSNSLDFFTLPPCRLIDTRGSGPLGGPALSSGEIRTFKVSGACGLPDNAHAISANITVIQASGNGHITVFAFGETAPATSTVNFSAGVVRANSALLELSDSGELLVKTFVAGSGSLHLVVDLNGFFR